MSTDLGIGSILENLSLETSKEYLPASVSKLINTNYYSKDTYFTGEEIVTGLNSGNDSAVYIILKFLVRILTTKRKYAEVNEAFPHVIKNINSSNMKIRRLVYYLLLRFSQEQPDISLLSINAIQKSLSDQSCISRALGIRCLSGIRIPAIIPILSLSLKKSVKDSSALVRSASAVAVTKCFLLDRTYNQEVGDKPLGELLDDPSSLTSQLYGYLDTLLSDNDSRVVGSAIVCFHTVFPGCFDLIHGKLPHLIAQLNYLDDYSTEILLDTLTDYSKLFFLPTEGFTEEAQYPQELRDLLINLRFLVYSDASNVILAVSRCASALFPLLFVSELHMDKVLLKYVHRPTRCYLSPSHTQELFLYEIDHLLTDRHLLEFTTTAQLANFVPRSTDSYNATKAKVSILFHLLSPVTFDYIFEELRFVVENSARPLALRKFTLQRLNSILVTDLSVTQLSKIVRFFMAKLATSGGGSSSDSGATSGGAAGAAGAADSAGAGEAGAGAGSDSDGEPHTGDDDLISEYITGLRQLIQSDVVGYVDVLIKLTGKLLDSAVANSGLAPIAQATIVWLLGEFVITAPEFTSEDLQLEDGNSDKTKIAVLQGYLPDLFRMLVSHFKELDAAVKLEILEALAKLLTTDIYKTKKVGAVYDLQGNDVFKLFNYVLQLTKYDHDTDLRDRSRFVGSILPNVVYGENNQTTSNQLNIDGLLQDPSTATFCDDKITAIELAVLIFQTQKPPPTAGASTDDSDAVECIKQYHNVTTDTLDPGLLDYYNEVRGQGFELKDYNKYSNGISSSQFSSSALRSPRLASSSSPSSSASPVMPGISSHNLPVQNWDARPNTNKYKLQTLDDFLED